VELSGAKWRKVAQTGAKHCQVAQNSGHLAQSGAGLWCTVMTVRHEIIVVITQNFQKIILKLLSKLLKGAFLRFDTTMLKKRN
jgi:hypothetical protein